MKCDDKAAPDPVITTDPAAILSCRGAAILGKGGSGAAACCCRGWLARGHLCSTIANVHDLTLSSLSHCLSVCR